MTIKNSDECLHFHKIKSRSKRWSVCSTLEIFIICYTIQLTPLTQSVAWILFFNSMIEIELNCDVNETSRRVDGIVV